MMKRILTAVIAFELLVLAGSLLPLPERAVQPLDLLRSAHAFIVHPSMMGVWRFENTGVDASGLGHLLTVRGTYSSSGKYGKALLSNQTANSGAYRSLLGDAHFTLTTGFTLSAWINATSTTWGYRPYEDLHYVSAVWGFSAICRAWALGVTSSGYLQVKTYDGTTVASFTDASTVVSLSAWHHICGVYTGGTTGTNAFLYLDGVLVASGTLNKAPQATPAGAYFMVNEYFGVSTASFPGYTDEVFVLNKALTSSGVRNLMHGFSPTE